MNFANSTTDYADYPDLNSDSDLTNLTNLKNLTTQKQFIIFLNVHKIIKLYFLENGGNNWYRYNHTKNTKNPLFKKLK